MSTRDPPDHCLAFWVPSSPSPTCHCPTRSLSAILTLCLPTRVQLVRCTNCMIFTLIENLIGYLTTSLQSCEIQLRSEHKFAGVFNCNTCRIYPSWHLPESCVCEAVLIVWSQAQVHQTSSEVVLLFQTSSTLEVKVNGNVGWKKRGFGKQKNCFELQADMSNHDLIYSFEFPMRINLYLLNIHTHTCSNDFKC